jgi:hypothetical protein
MNAMAQSKMKGLGGFIGAHPVFFALLVVTIVQAARGTTPQFP